MKVDLLRQLDEWGDHFAGQLDHVDAAEILERLPGESPAAQPSSRVRSGPPWWRTPIRYGGVLAVILALVFALPKLGSERMESFNSVGGTDGGRPRTTLPAVRPGDRLTLPSLSSPSTTAAPADTTAAPTTTVSSTASPATSTIPPAGDNPANLGRAVIFTGDLAIDTPDVAAAVGRARTIAESAGGYVFGQELGGESTVMSLKIPAPFFQDTVDRLSELGTVRNARISSQDVTERIVDLESQIVTAETSVGRLQELLGRAGNIESVARLESELLSRETDLERLRGRLRTLQDQVALSTIVLTFREFVPAPSLNVAVTTHPTGFGDGDACFTQTQSRIDPDGEYVLCVDITNRGDLELVDLEIVNGPQELLGDLRPISGILKDTLAPGERYVLWTSRVAGDSVNDEVKVQAIPLGETGERLIEQIVEDRAPIRITVNSESTARLPPLGDALSSGWTVLTTALNALAVAAAFVLPLLWLPLLLLAAAWWWRRRGS